MKKLLLISMLAATSVSAFSQGLTPKQAFAELKKLAGKWEMKGPDGLTIVTYKVTGAGSALVETQFAGEAHEMVSVYHMDGNDLYLTHYCAAGNQPTLKYVPGKDAKVLFFNFVRGTNMKPTDMHIHSAKHYLKGTNDLQSDWTGWSGGKPGSSITLKVKRVKS
jgi:hypothetical protein